MPLGQVVQRAFAAGELAPALYARADVARYSQGLRTCRNFVIQRAGGVANRGGTCTAGLIAGETGWIVPYIDTGVYASVLLELCDNTMRFWYPVGDTLERLEVTSATAWSGATDYVVGDVVSSGGVFYYCVLAHTNHAPPNATYWHPLPANGANGIYELPTPWPAGVRNTATWQQSGGVLSFADVSYPPQELHRLGEESWALIQVDTGPDIEAPENLLVAITPGNVGLYVHNYVVTAVAADTYEESAPSTFFQLALAGLATPLLPHVLTWDAVPGAVEYRIYKDQFYNGTYGYIGTATGAETFNDVGFAPDMTLTPPLQRDLFQATDAYPAVVGVAQQRRWFGRTGAEPEKVWGSQIGFPSNFNIRSPLQDDDAVTFELAGNDSQVIRHLLDLKKVVVLTDTGEWILDGDDQNGTVIPTSINPRQHGYAGASRVKPVVVGNTLIFNQSRASIIRDLRFDQQVEGYSGRDLTVFSSHLFDDHTISRMAYQQNPNSLVWCVRDDGVLLVLTYMPEHEVWGWARFDTGEDEGDRFEDVAVMKVGNEDVVCVLVARESGRYIERCIPRRFGEDAWYVDAGVSAESVSTLTGLDHLEGRVLAVVADGNVLYNGDPSGADAATWTVSGGELALGDTYDKVQAGLRVRYQLETLDLDSNGTDIRGRRKRVQDVTLLVERSSRAFFAGPEETKMIQYRRELWESLSNDEVTKPLEMALTSKFDNEGRTLVYQNDPLPLTVLAIIPNVEVGG